LQIEKPPDLFPKFDVSIPPEAERLRQSFAVLALRRLMHLQSQKRRFVERLREAEGTLSIDSRVALPGAFLEANPRLARSPLLPKELCVLHKRQRSSKRRKAHHELLDRGGAGSPVLDHADGSVDGEPSAKRVRGSVASGSDDDDDDKEERGSGMDSDGERFSGESEDFNDYADEGGFDDDDDGRDDGFDDGGGFGGDED
jgi:hypothetical protein